MRFICIFLLAVLSLSAYSAVAQQQPAHDSEIIKYSSHRQVKGNKLIVTETFIIRINNREGESAADVELVYSKGEKPSIEYAWIEDMEGNIIRKLNNNEIKDRNCVSDATLYQDEFLRSFQLRHNRYPYRVVYSYKTTMSKFFQIASIDYSHRGKPVHEGELVVEIPSDEKIKFRQRNIDKPMLRQENGTSVYTWNFSYTPRTYQINAPYTDEKAPLLQILPIEFRYGIPGNTQNWKSFGNWIYRLNYGRDKLPEAEKSKIDDMLAGINDKKEKCKTLFHYMQDYNRYINVSIDIGGLQAYPAEYVCANRYGDCKALTNYMKAVLRHAGIDSYYTLINLNEEVKDIDAGFASQAFNHAILTVPFESDTLYLECTSKNLPFGYVHTSIQNRKALLIDEADSHLINIPALSWQDVACSRKFDILLSEEGMDYVDMSMTQKGSSFESAMYLNTSDKKEIVERYIARNSPANISKFGEYSLEKQPRESTDIRLSANYHQPVSSKMYGNNLVITPFVRKMASYEVPGKREQQVRLDCPQYYADTCIYTIPHKEISKLPDNIVLVTPFGTYTQEYEKAGKKLHVYKTIHIYAGKYDLDEYEAFYKFMQAVRSNENKKIYLEIL